MWSSPSSPWSSDVSISPTDWSSSVISPYSFSNTWSPSLNIDNTKPMIPSTPVNLQLQQPTSDFIHVSNNFGWNPIPIANAAKIQPQQQIVGDDEGVQKQNKKNVVSAIEEEISGQNLYKTELCRSFEDTGSCRYGTKCQFAHGKADLRPVLRHPKYKTEICKTFFNEGTCPYGRRCRFIHSTSPEINIPIAGNQPIQNPRVSSSPISPNSNIEPTTRTKFFVPGDEIQTTPNQSKEFISISNSTNWEPSSIISSNSTSPQTSPTQSWVEAHMSALSISSPSSELVQLVPDQTEERSRGRLSFFESISSTK